MADSPNLVLPYIEAAQAQKHVTHNEAVRALDAIVQLAVLDRDLAAPPGSPVEGTRYIVAVSPTGAWNGQSGKIAAWQDGAWMFYTPREGWHAWIADENVGVVYDGAAWITFGGAGSGGSLWGVNTTADTTNRLAVKSDAVLLSHDDVTPGSGDVRAKLNKSAANKTASFLFQDAFSSRAEIGLTGDDDFHFKVSADGSAFKDAIIIDRATGKARFPFNTIAEAPVFNLLADGGRFCTSASYLTESATTYEFPSYLGTFNGCVQSNLGKYITNSSTFGGAAAALHAEVQALVEKIRTGDFRRYNIEFFVSSLVAGSGTSGSLGIGADTFYLAAYNRFSPRLPTQTWHTYVRQMSGKGALKNSTFATIIIDGVPLAYGAHYVLQPADGWKSVAIQESLNPQESYGYQPYTFAPYLRTSGDQMLIALPCITPGLVAINPYAGLIASYSSWSK